MCATALVLLLLAGPPPVEVRHAPGSLHGFPSMSDEAGRVLADGELTQEAHGERLAVRVRWSFRDGRVAEERDLFRAGRTLAQERYAWVEARRGEELRRFEVDFASGTARATTRRERGEVERSEEHLDLPAGRAFAGYGVALAASQLDLAAGAKAELTLVAFTPRPRAVTLEVRRGREERVTAAGRALRCDAYTLHPLIPFPLNLVAGAKDAHLWLTHGAPPALVRAEQSLAAKDDPVVIVDVIPRGPAHAPAARAPPSPHRGRGVR